MNKHELSAKMLCFLTFAVHLLLGFAENDFQCGVSLTISEQDPLLIYHADEVWRYTGGSENYRICVDVACQDCTVQIEYTRTCPASIGEEHCPDETRIRLNGEMLAKDVCKSSYKDPTNESLLETCGYQVNGDFNFDYYLDEGSYYESSSAVISFQVKEWMLDEYDYALNPIQSEWYSEAEDFVLVEDSSRPTWVILPLSEIINFFIQKMNMTPDCEYELIIGPPPGKANADYSWRKLLTFRDIPVEEFVPQLMDSSNYGLRVPAHCPARIDLCSFGMGGYGGVEQQICAGDTFLVNADFAISSLGDFQRPMIWRWFTCIESMMNITFEIDTFLDGELTILGFKDFYAQKEESKFVHTDKIEAPLYYQATDIVQVEVKWLPGDTRGGMLAKVHFDRGSPIPVSTTEEPTESTSTMEPEKTTRSRVTRHETTTKLTNQVSLCFAPRFVLLYWLSILY